MLMPAVACAGGADCHVKLIQILSEVLQLDFDEVAFDQEKGAIHERG